MSTPPKATPTTPQWILNAAEEFCVFTKQADSSQENLVSIITKHAPPPAAQPSDAAGLREAAKALCLGGDAIESALSSFDQREDHFGHKQAGINNALNMVRMVQKKLESLTALAPYLKGEPGDSELLEWASGNFAAIVFKWEQSDGFLTMRELIKSTMRGEGDKP